MPAPREREPSSLRSRWLGHRLRELREDRGLTIKYAANHLGVEYTELAGHEHGRQAFVFDKVAALLDLYSVYDRVERDQLLTLARQVFRLPRWQDDFAGPDLDVSTLDYLWLESVARRIHCYEPALVPPLLRTPKYVDAVVRREMTNVSDALVSWWVHAYQDRQQTLDNGQATNLRVVLAESVLRRPVGGPTGTLPGQLKHLTGQAGRDRIQMRILPAESGYVPGMDGWLTIFELPKPYPSRVACTSHHRGVAIHEDAAAEQYAGTFDQLWNAALTPTDSLTLIGNLANDLSPQPTN